MKNRNLKTPQQRANLKSILAPSNGFADNVRGHQSLPSTNRRTRELDNLNYNRVKAKSVEENASPRGKNIDVEDFGDCSKVPSHVSCELRYSERSSKSRYSDRSSKSSSNDRSSKSSSKSVVFLSANQGSPVRRTPRSAPAEMKRVRSRLPIQSRLLPHEKPSERKESPTKTIDLVIFFGDECRCRGRRGIFRASRNITCKSSEYPIDILKRVRERFIPTIPIDELSLRLVPQSHGSKRCNGSTDLNLVKKTIGEIGIFDNKLVVQRHGVQNPGWIPLPITGAEVWIYCTYSAKRFEEALNKQDFLYMTKTLGIDDRSQACKVWDLIQCRRQKEIHAGIFWKVFPKAKNFLDSFYQALLSTEVVLSDSYVRFFIKLETDVWQNLQIRTFEKEEVIMSMAYEAIKETVRSNEWVNDEKILGVILEFYGDSAIPVPYRVKARERFFLRKEGIEKSQLHFENIILEEVLEKAKNDIYEQLVKSTLVECNTSLVHSKKVRVDYIIQPSLIGATINSHFCNDNSADDELRFCSKRPLIASEAVVRSLMKHFKDEGFKVSKIWFRSGIHNDDKKRREQEHLEGLTVTWNSSGVQPVNLNIIRKC